MADSKEILGRITGVKVRDPSNDQWSTWKTTSSEIYEEYTLPKKTGTTDLRQYQLIYRIEYDTDDWEARRLTFYGEASYVAGENATQKETFISPFVRNDITEGSTIGIIANTGTNDVANGETKEIRFYGVLGSVNYFAGEKTLYFYVKASVGTDDKASETFQTETKFKAVKCGAISFPPAMSISATPTSLPAGHKVTINTQNRSGISLHYEFAVNGKIIYSEDGDSDSYQVTTHPSWFDNAGTTGNSMSVSVTASDEYGRTASTGFTLTRPQAPVVTLTSPTSGTKDGAAAINFVWTISAGSGTVTGTQMQYSIDDGINWNTLVESESSIESYQSAAGKFHPGKVSWRVRAKDSLAGWGEWKKASFTVTYTGASVSLTAPTSGSRDGAAAIDFGWTITAGSGTVSGTQMEYSTDDGLKWSSLLDSESAVTSYQSNAGKFPAGKVTWRVRAKDSYSGWGEWRSASFTVTYAAVSVSLTTPTSGTKDGGKKISFAWTITPGSGTVTGTAMEYSTDEGVTWTPLFDVSSEKTSYESSAGQFPDGKLNWRVRAKDSYSGWGEWRSASFTVVYNKPTVNLTTPTSGTKDGGEQITFAWTIKAGSGTVTGTQMQYSTDDGVNWTNLINASERIESYIAPAVKFPAGKIAWRVRARDSYSYSDWGEWKSASFTVAYSGVSQVIAVNSPTSGRIAAASAQRFQVHLDATSPVYTPFTVSAASFFWRYGTSGDFTEVSMTPDGANASVTITGGTFPSGTIQWYASATDQTGRTTETAVYTLQALNAEVEAVPLAPIDTIEGTSSDISFSWLYYSLDGTAQSRAVIEYSRDMENWYTVADIAGSAESYTAPAGFFSAAGVVYWRVQAFNSSGTAGPKSAVVSFTLFGASSVTSVIGDGKPFATIQWQAEGQVSYEVRIGDKHFGPYFSAAARSYKITEPLEDRVYTVGVRIQNRYGIWSEWAEAEMRVANGSGALMMIQRGDGGSINRWRTYRSSVEILFSWHAPIIYEQPVDRKTPEEDVSFTVKMRKGVYVQWEKLAAGSSAWVQLGEPVFTNDEYSTLNVTGVSGKSGNQYRARVWTESGEVYSRAALLRYGTPAEKGKLIIGFFPSETGYYMIYRDGKYIGKTYAQYFDDRAAIGKHTYQAMQALPDGNVSRSNVITIETWTKCPIIAPLAGGEFVELSLSTDGDRAQEIHRSRETAHTYYSGAHFPASEVGEAETLTASFDVAYPHTDKEAADAFEALVGEDVILRTPGGYVIVGTLEGFDLHDPNAYKSYSCTLQQMDWRDFAYVP